MARYQSTSPSEESRKKTPTKSKPKFSGRVHILGSGNMGVFIAHALRTRDSPPPVSLLLHNWGMYEAFMQRKKRIAITYDGLDDIQKGFDIEVNTGPNNKSGKWYQMPPLYGQKYYEDGTKIAEEDMAEPELTREPIDCLIVTCKSQFAFIGLRALFHRITPDTTILFLQNGLGVVERVNELLYNDRGWHPHYMQAVLSHRMDKKDAYAVKFLQTGAISLAPAATQAISKIPAEEDTNWPPTMKYLTRLFTLTPPLVATASTTTDVLQSQLEKLAVRCVIDPLTAINDCKNGELLHSYSSTRIMRLLLFEISSVITALPELQGVPGIDDRFSANRLLRLVTQTLHRNSGNTSPMVHDVRLRKSTEVEFFNGYIVRRGQEVGITCTMNYMIKHLVHSKKTINRRAEDAQIPIDTGDDEGIYLTGKHEEVENDELGIEDEYV
ncbi:hypothetical protein N7532_001445 [Penicillium argentinense]|uniref:2-dehydropantoate 2-reductase n=1 Tax=Penicillium argentinense TaxID=1131581 RepID=A0A9W9KLS7_9EURO|nr:uncharacterized protein N7532_001445 [Penicillium argentinense]KAJ5110910.1 hypothetical protein N7532_001445 [Penicillium argentinense]